MPPKSNNLIDRTDPTFWKKQQISKNAEEKQDNNGTDTKQAPLHTEKKTNSSKEIKSSQEKLTESEKVTHITSHTQFNIEKEGADNNHLSICDSPKTEEKNSWYKSWPTAIALCLCLALLPFIKNINQPKDNNIQASHPVEAHPSLRGLATGAREAKKKRLIKRYERDNQRAINILKEQRRLASVGRKPSIKDNFSHELLHSRYRVRWRRNKLNYFNLLEGQEPLSNLKIENIIAEYNTLFPSHENIQGHNRDGMETLKLYGTKGSSIARIEKKLKKNGFSITQMETYTLQNKGASVATITVFTDDNGHLLAMHVQ